MSLVVGSDTNVPTTGATEIATYTASAGDFFRGWKVHGEAEAKVEVQIAGTARAIGAIKTGPNGAGDWNEDGQVVTPIALIAAQVIRIMITRKEQVAGRLFRGEIF